MRDWPTRERWAYHHHHPYWDSETGCPFADKLSHRLSDYATPKEIATLIAALQALYRNLGREMSAAKLAAGPLGQQSGETKMQWVRRTYTMQEHERQVAWAASDLQYRRREINKALAIISGDCVPKHWHHWRWEDNPLAVLLHPVNERYFTAFHAAREQWERKCQDAAWERELQRRAAIEAKAAS